MRITDQSWPTDNLFIDENSKTKEKENDAQIDYYSEYTEDDNIVYESVGNDHNEVGNYINNNSNNYDEDKINEAVDTEQEDSDYIDLRIQEQATVPIPHIETINKTNT